jgi:hypothetical protein
LFQNIENLKSRFKSLGATRLFFKCLAENDNSKNQIYLGGSFAVLSYFQYGNVTSFPDAKYPNFKAPIKLYWFDAEHIEQATSAQLILYPQYPEVRLSGFLRACTLAPSKFLQPTLASKRSGIDGRVLFFGTTEDGTTLVYLAEKNSAIATFAIHLAGLTQDKTLFHDLSLSNLVQKPSKILLLDALREIHLSGFVDSIRLNKLGERKPYSARNGGGYTLEALLGIKPNAVAGPDYLGWEVKAFSSSRITLMTPEPNSGFYGDNGVEAFVRKYGRQVANKNQLYFTGNHVFDQSNKTTGLKLIVDGFDSNNQKITNVNGSILLIDQNVHVAASWSFSHLLNHWNKKHASAAYVPFKNNKGTPPKYQFGSPVSLGEGTDFSKYLHALAQGKIIFDPGSKVENPDTINKSVKARSQFRINKKDLHLLYEHFEEVQL